jgi:hypothetical protein
MSLSLTSVAPNVVIVLNLLKVASHSLRTPACISSQARNVIPVIVRWKGKIQGIMITAATQRTRSRIQDAEGLGTFWRVGADIVIIVNGTPRVLGISVRLLVILIMVYEELP